MKMSGPAGTRTQISPLSKRVHVPIVLPGQITGEVSWLKALLWSESPTSPGLHIKTYFVVANLNLPSCIRSRILRLYK